MSQILKDTYLKMKEAEKRRRAAVKQKAKEAREAALRPKEPEPEVDDSAGLKFLEDTFEATLEALR